MTRILFIVYIKNSLISHLLLTTNSIYSRASRIDAHTRPKTPSLLNDKSRKSKSNTYRTQLILILFLESRLGHIKSLLDLTQPYYSVGRLLHICKLSPLVETLISFLPVFGVHNEREDRFALCLSVCSKRYPVINQNFLILADESWYMNNWHVYNMHVTMFFSQDLKLWFLWWRK